MHAITGKKKKNNTFNPIELKMAKIPLSFGYSGCSRVNAKAKNVMLNEPL